MIPPRVACLSQKGGGGKTTIATNLAVAGALAGANTLLLDLDPQQSSMRAWASWRSRRKPRPRAALTAQACSWDNLEPTLNAAEKAKHGLVVLDTPGTKGNITNYAAGASNIILIIVQPSMLDLATLNETLGLNNVMGRPAFVLFNRVSDKASLKEAQEVVTGLGLAMAPVSLSNLAAYREAAGEGLGALEYMPPKGASKAAIADAAKAKKEITDLFAWVREELARNPHVKERYTHRWGRP